jgi:hypothetical protein
MDVPNRRKEEVINQRKCGNETSGRLVRLGRLRRVKYRSLSEVEGSTRKRFGSPSEAEGVLGIETLKGGRNECENWKR